MVCTDDEVEAQVGEPAQEPGPCGTSPGSLPRVPQREAPRILPAPKKVIALYVDHFTRQWIALDREGNLWAVPAGENGWANLRLFYRTEDTELELVPRHYQHMLGLPLN